MTPTRHNEKNTVHSRQDAAARREGKIFFLFFFNVSGRLQK